MINKKKGKKKFVIIFIAIAAVVAIVLNMNSKSANPAAEYDSETVKKGDIITYYSFSGNIETKDEKQVVAEGMVKINKFYVSEGDIVNAGDLIYTIDISDSKASLKQAAAAVEIAQINYENAKNGMADQQLIQLDSAVSSSKLSYDNAVKNLERITALYDEGGISEQNLEQAISQHDLAKEQYESAVKNYNLVKDEQINVSIDAAAAQLKQAEAAYEAVENQVGETEIYAEIKGEITDIFADENSTIMAGTPILNIVDYSDMKAVVKVDEYDINSVSVGEEVIVRVDALGKEYKGIISKISKSVIQNTGVSLNQISYYTADIEIEDSTELYAGMSVEVKALNQSADDAITISMKALQFDNENMPYVYYMNEKGEIATKYVKLGINDGITVQITEGLNENDVIQVPKSFMFNPFVNMGR